jgi:midasin (ATPase involved in ribosome maturation)
MAIRLILVFIMSLATFVPIISHADAIDDLSDNYVKCVVQLKHLSDADVQQIKADNKDISAMADTLAHRSMESCSAERLQLVELLQSKSNYGPKLEKALADTDTAAMYMVKMNVLRSLLDRMKAEKGEAASH